MEPSLDKCRFDRAGATAFVAKLLYQAEQRGHPTRDWVVDHVCFRTETWSEYQSLVAAISNPTHDLYGTVLSHAEVNGRPITTVRLSEPLQVRGKWIEAIEIPAPKENQFYKSGYEHIEVLITKDLTESSVTLDHGKIKFHPLPLSSAIALENHVILSQWLARTNILRVLKPWMPLLSGSILLELDLPGSDLDILLGASDIDVAAQEVRQTLRQHHISEHLSWQASQTRLGRCLTANLTADGLAVELFLSTVKPLDQNSHRHLLSEYCLLVRHGESLRTRVKSLKVDGFTTEEAFAKALNLKGDPYDLLLHPEISGLRRN